jgi:hypothetical protein
MVSICALITHHHLLTRKIHSRRDWRQRKIREARFSRRSSRESSRELRNKKDSDENFTWVCTQHPETGMNVGATKEKNKNVITVWSERRERFFEWELVFSFILFGSLFYWERKSQVHWKNNQKFSIVWFTLHLFSFHCMHTLFKTRSHIRQKEETPQRSSCVSFFSRISLFIQPSSSEATTNAHFLSIL